MNWIKNNVVGLIGLAVGFLGLPITDLLNRTVVNFLNTSWCWRFIIVAITWSLFWIPLWWLIRQSGRKNADSWLWQQELKKLKKVKTEGGAVVYETIDEPVHYVCPSCTNKQEIHPLDSETPISGRSKCPGCNNFFRINKAGSFVLSNK